jgi:uncharacterized protein YunC (DUF1805 family)
MIENQTILHEGPRGRICAMDSAYHVAADNRGRDVAVNASYCGVLPARFIAAHAPRAAIGVDCAIGPAGASIAGLWYLEALHIPAAVADVMTVRLGDGQDLHDNGIVSFVNQPAASCGVVAGMSVREAARLLLENDPQRLPAEGVTNRTVLHVGADGRKIVATDSIAFALPEDRRNVLLTAGHTGRSALPYLLKARPHGFICSDGGRGREDSGIAALAMVEPHGLCGATVDARTAAMGNGLATYAGTISAANLHARRAGIEPGMSAREAAQLMLNNHPIAVENDT